MSQPLFECDFSVDELAVLADLLEITALPGGDPGAELSEGAKAAAARGLLARGVRRSPTGQAGSVEITQPYATMIGIVIVREGSDDDVERNGRLQERRRGDTHRVDIARPGDVAHLNRRHTTEGKRSAPSRRPPTPEEWRSRPPRNPEEAAIQGARGEEARAGAERSWSEGSRQEKLQALALDLMHDR